MRGMILPKSVGDQLLDRSAYELVNGVPKKFLDLQIGFANASGLIGDNNRIGGEGEEIFKQACAA